MYGLLYSVTVLSILIPMLLISDAGLGHYPSFGLEVRINKPQPSWRMRMKNS
jgi:hypothetical protein